ncbi:M23 family metallopeptidase [Ekhidna sp. To15]|uniref:M23 family metallopeptidase n=1 Tax=Ekhidna sp. To15 TaxID=3395267 RepID=UPI003F51FA49
MKFLPSTILFILALGLFGQDLKSIDYQFPINPGQQNYLAGTVGEIRSSHFHTGIDVKTGGRTGLPIYAVADGYIARIKVSASGYGYALYMKHPNGTFSVYAHLEAFDPKIAAWILKEQYRKKSFEVDLFPEAAQFAFKKGNIIGYSGNTGSSSGPHLHFEIRDANHQPIDVLTLGFKEIRDKIPPVVKKVAFVTLDGEARINGFFGRYEFDLIKTESWFQTKEPIYLQGNIGVEIYSYDPMDGIPNKNGIVKTTFQLDGDTLFSEHKELFSFGKQRNVLVHYNYPAYKKGSRRFNKLYLADGNEHNIYNIVNRGIRFENQREILINTEDSYKNSSTTRILLNSDKVTEIPTLKSVEQIGNFLHFKSSQQASVLLDEWINLAPYQEGDEYKYYLWDLRNGTPKSLFIEGETIPTNLVGLLPSHQEISYIQPEFTLSLTRRSLFDTVFLAFEKRIDSAKNMELFHFKNPTQPIRSNVSITLNPQLSYNQDKAMVYSVFGKRFNFMGGEWEDNQITFSTRDLVNYTILEDTIPPSITLKMANSDMLKFRIDDELSGIKSFKASINGEFVLMHYEPKRKLLWSEKLNKNIPFRGRFMLEVIDNSNNETIYTKTL